MATVESSLLAGHGYLADFFVPAAVVAGQVLIREATATNVGEVATPASTTSVIAMVGVAQNAATFTAAPTADPRYDLGGNLLFVANSLENLVRVEINPLAVYRFPIAGGTAAGTVLQPSTSTPANILSQDTASASVITDTAVGTINMAGGLIKGRTGNNVGQIRKLNAHVNSVSTTVGIAFLNTDVIGNTYIRVPYSRMVAAMQMTATFIEANGIIATGTGAIFRVVRVFIDEQNDVASVHVVHGGHFHGGGALT